MVSEGVNETGEVRADMIHIDRVNANFEVALHPL